MSANCKSTKPSARHYTLERLKDSACNCTPCNRLTRVLNVYCIFIFYAIICINAFLYLTHCSTDGQTDMMTSGNLAY